MKCRLKPLAIVIAAALFIGGCASNTSGERSTQRTGSAVERISPVRVAEINTRLGVGYLEQGNLQIAMEKLEQAVEQDPDHAPALLALGIVYDSIGQTERALPHVRRAVRLAPEDGSAHNSYATLLCKMQRFDEAEQHFVLALEDPFYGTPDVVLANAGSCARRANESDKAERYLRETLNIDPNNQIALFNLAGLFYDQGEPMRARAFLQRLESQGRLDADSLLLGYRVEHALNSHSEAERYAIALQTYYPNSAQLTMLRQEMTNE